MFGVDAHRSEAILTTDNRRPTTADLPLFAGVPIEPVPPADPLRERRKAMDAAFAAADERWREEYTAFVLRFLVCYGRATAETIRLAYEARPELPQTSKSKRASGAIFTQLRRMGRIREVGRELSRKYGNGLAVYELQSCGVAELQS